MTAPKPHDPRTPRVKAEDIDAEVAEILGEEAETLKDVAMQLTRAHDVVQAALQ